MGWLLLAGRGVFYVPRRLAGFNFPLAAPSSTAKLGVFGEDCLSEASSAARTSVALRPKDEAAAGCRLLGLLSFQAVKRK